MNLQIEYFAILRDQAGAATEEFAASSGETPAGLYAVLRARHGFALEPQYLRVAVNDEFVTWEHALQAGDRVVFIPPVAGG